MLQHLFGWFLALACTTLAKQALCGLAITKLYSMIFYVRVIAGEVYLLNKFADYSIINIQNPKSKSEAFNEDIDEKWYWEGANRENIYLTIKEQFQKWLSKFEQEHQ